MQLTRLFLAMCFAVVFSPLLAFAAAPRTNNNPHSIPYVPTRHDTVRDLLWLADVSTNDVVYDLGSGDGRIVIAAVRDFHARKAVGVEMSSNLVRESRGNATSAGVSNRVEFIQGNLFATDCRDATVAVLYLGHEPNLELRSSLFRSLKPGTRLVSHQFGMGEWTPDKKLEVRTPLLGMYSEMHNPFGTNTDTPDYRVPFTRLSLDTVSMWVLPAPVAGTWRGKVTLESGEAELTIMLHQRLSMVNGSFEIRGAMNVSGGVNVDMWGEKVRLNCWSTNGSPYGDFLWFEGGATNDTLNGQLWLSLKQGTQTLDWTARREKTDFSGLWTWEGAWGKQVELNIGRREGKRHVTYHEPHRPVTIYEKNEPIVVTDFYDFGSGFYFTALLGQQPEGGRRLGPYDGWLIGEASMVKGTMTGTIAFHPYPEYIFSRMANATSPNRPIPQKIGPQEWQPQRGTHP